MSALQKSNWSATRVASTLDIRYPIIQGPFGNGLSSVGLVAAVNNAGGLGSFGLAGFEPERYAEIGASIRALTSAPFALNLWVPHYVEKEQRIDRAMFERAIRHLAPVYADLGAPLPTWEEIDVPPMPSFDVMAEALLQVGPPVASFIYGVPSGSLLLELRRRGIVSMGTATNVMEGEALDAANVDVIIASGSDAGGHRSSFLRSAAESLTTSALVQQLAARTNAPVVAAGGIVDGRGMASAMMLGAEGVQIGTAFLATHESAAPEAHKTAMTAPGQRSTILTTVFSGRPARALVNRFVQEIGMHEQDMLPYPWQHLMTQPLRLAAAAQGRTEWMSLWSGQNVPLVARKPAATLMQELVADVAARSN